MVRSTILRTLLALVLSCSLVPLAKVFSQKALEDPQQKEEPKGEDGSKMVATVNGEPVTEAEIDTLSKLKGSKQKREYVTQIAIQREVAEQFLDKKGITVDREKVDEEVKVGRKRLKDQGMDLEDRIQNLGITEKDLRDEIEFRLRLDKYIRSTITKEEVVENMVRVSASHILVNTEKRTDEDALAKIKRIESELRASSDLPAAFAEAAEKYSDCPTGKNSKGRIRPFYRMEMVKPFSDTAFSLMPGQMSAPVKTRFGYHLILLHKRTPVTEADYEKRGEFLTRLYAEYKKENFVLELTKKADIVRYGTQNASEGDAESSDQEPSDDESGDQQTGELDD